MAGHPAFKHGDLFFLAQRRCEPIGLHADVCHHAEVGCRSAFAGCLSGVHCARVPEHHGPRGACDVHLFAVVPVDMLLGQFAPVLSLLAFDFAAVVGQHPQSKVIGKGGMFFVAAFEQGERAVSFANVQRGHPALVGFQPVARGALVQVEPVFVVPASASDFGRHAHGPAVEGGGQVVGAPQLCKDGFDFFADVPDGLAVPKVPVLDEHAVVRVVVIDVLPGAGVAGHCALLPERPKPVLHGGALLRVEHVGDDDVAMFV